MIKIEDFKNININSENIPELKELTNFYLLLRNLIKEGLNDNDKKDIENKLLNLDFSANAQEVLKEEKDRVVLKASQKRKSEAFVSPRVSADFYIGVMILDLENLLNQLKNGVEETE